MKVTTTPLQLYLQGRCTPQPEVELFLADQLMQHSAVAVGPTVRDRRIVYNDYSSVDEMYQS